MSDKRLNSLDQFRKQSGRLVLEEHSHCEVPAGCGGVVLRWRNPLARQLLSLELWCPVEPECAVDGLAVDSSMIDLAPGPHVVSLVLKDAGLSAGLLMFALVRHRGADPKIDSDVKVLSSADGSWKFSLAAPADAWMLTPEDGDWPALVETPPPQDASQGWGGYQMRRCADQGAVCLGVPAAHRPGGSGTVWVRKAFLVPAPARSPSQP